MAEPWMVIEVWGQGASQPAGQGQILLSGRRLVSSRWSWLFPQHGGIVQVNAQIYKNQSWLCDLCECQRTRSILWSRQNIDGLAQIWHMVSWYFCILLDCPPKLDWTCALVLQLRDSLECDDYRVVLGVNSNQSIPLFFGVFDDQLETQVIISK